MANLYEFIHYYGSHKCKNKNVTQIVKNNVDTNKDIILKFRVSKELAQKIKEKCQEKDKDFSKLNRILWKSYFKVENNNSWKHEVESW